jgi:hypothetical protein
MSDLGKAIEQLKVGERLSVALGSCRPLNEFTEKAILDVQDENELNEWHWQGGEQDEQVMGV